MNLTETGSEQLENSSLTRAERALVRCRLASEQIEIGRYEKAREVLGDLWRGVGERPNVDKLRPAVCAEVLMQCGALSGWLGEAQNLHEAQDSAKDLLFESLRIFKDHTLWTKAAEARYELSKCYFRLGSYDDARIMLEQALDSLEEKDNDLKARILIRHAVLETWTGRFRDAWDVLESIGMFLDTISEALKGKWHSQRALILTRLASAEKRVDFSDRAIIEYTAAVYHCELAGHERYCGNNLNNLAFLLHTQSRYGEAHERLDRAEEIFECHRDPGNLACVRETRARVLIAENRNDEADRLISEVVKTFELGNEYALLTDALTTQGLARARLNQHESSIQILRHAMSVGQNAGAHANAGRAALTLIEEHGADRLSPLELYDIYRRADELLKDTEDAEEIARLRACARIMSRRTIGVRLSDRGFRLPKIVHDYEAKFIREALEATDGVVSRAAGKLGIRHQTLIRALETRHRDLLACRTTPRIRRKTIILKSR